jgi:hypothetical protein
MTDGSTPLHASQLLYQILNMTFVVSPMPDEHGQLMLAGLDGLTRGIDAQYVPSMGRGGRSTTHEMKAV